MGERYVHVGKVRSRSGALHSGTRTPCLDVRPPATCAEAARHLRLALLLHAIDACFCAASVRVMLIQGSSRDSSDRPTADSAALHGPQSGGLVDGAIVATAAPQRRSDSAATPVPRPRRRRPDFERPPRTD